MFSVNDSYASLPLIVQMTNLSITQRRICLFVCFSFLYKAMVISYSQVKMSYNAKFKPRSRYPFKNSVGYIVV